MTLQLISLLVIIAVLVIDFIINGRKKGVDDTQKRIQGNEGLKKFNLAEYLLGRKKNALIFILFVFLSKPILHNSFFTETKEAINYNSKVLDNSKSKDYYMMDSEGQFVHLRDTLSKINKRRKETTLRLKEYSKSFNEYLKSINYRLTITSDLHYQALNGEAYTKKGEKYIYEVIDGGSFIVFYYPLETFPLSFNEHLEVMFKSKLWIFLVSILVLTVIVFLFNDKIKAR